MEPFNFHSEDYDFGEWQASLALFSKALKDLEDFNLHRSNQDKINSLIRQQKDYSSLWDRQNKLHLIKSEEMDLEERQYQRLILLRDSNTISLKEFESGVAVYLDAKYSLESAGTLLSQTKIQIDQLDHQIIVVEKDYLEGRDQKINLLQQAYNQLAGVLSAWKLNYTFISPMDGIVTFTRIWSKNQSVIQGERVLTLISGEPGPILGKMLLPLKGAGKVKTGQKVIIRIDRFPYMEYGSIKGKVGSMSLVSDQEYYSVEISLPDGLKTSYNKDLKFNQGMTGQAEIITDELSLLVRIVNPIRSILKRNEILN
jgi:HlyD family secretion protein